MNKIAGFSLIEMAMGLVIIGLLVGSLLVPGVEQSTQQKIKLTQQTLEEIKTALLGFAEANNRLPCPAIDSKGKEANFTDAYNAALAVEILHNFTLVHDDIMDGDEMNQTGRGEQGK